MSIERIIRTVPQTPATFPPWKCLMCGDCCEQVSISKPEYRMILKKLGPKAKKHFLANTIIHPENKKYMLIEGKCWFLLSNNHCGIHRIRPFACRLFMCGRQSLDEPLIIQGDKCQNHMIRRNLDPYFREQSKTNEKLAKDWGVKYGWPRRKYKHESTDTVHRKIR